MRSTAATKSADETAPARACDTLLFDLDGTLVGFRRRRSLYLRLLARATWRFAPVIAPWRFPSIAARSLAAVRQNDSDRTNHDVLVEALARGAGAAEEAIASRLDRFAREDFAHAREFLPIPGAREVLMLALEHGYRLVLATNPVFPLATITQRLAWAGLADIPFVFISHSGVMTRCKPRVAYFEEILRHIGVEPAACAMIGDDAEKDLPARQAGIRTFLVEPWIAGSSAETRFEEVSGFIVSASGGAHS